MSNSIADAVINPAEESAKKFSPIAAIRTFQQANPRVFIGILIALAALIVFMYVRYKDKLPACLRMDNQSKEKKSKNDEDSKNKSDVDLDDDDEQTKVDDLIKSIEDKQRDNIGSK